MKNLLPFVLLIGFIAIQRVVELFIAKRNEIWMKRQGAVEFGNKHYKYMVFMHLLFFITLCSEKILLNRGLSPIWPIFLAIFILAQFIRGWAISSLGKFWNTKILVLKHALVIRKGPYRFLKHPNYFVVATELLVVPLLFNAFYTALLFSIFNFMILSIRIHEEEKALRMFTEYDEVFQDCHRFIPRIVK
ncbi:isoprenylcysteine carboxyl methyltransferase family protein [Neobacillus sp. NPDC093127]|uniref:isoprenylcysteine carboxyl methyltransferase family protein n=1 Tax=Neobacillus sp. NPDC093127 TaxID=3364296 RepID=UPI00381B4B54